ncbi:C-type lectin domain family 12 member B-like isoform X2 [Trematomus bernacchii]|uniref:C-type lectin domain family 12 member B-like isoform X2 n=1 Tax=Trematomus bernacchii TaxID=40690 RepID=UPI001469D7F8|nr:C-type lectin domain family 12 member B-like isoform X2 [Trematomus bernacchii]
MNRRTQQEMEEIKEQEDDYVNASRGTVDKKRTRPGRRFFLLIAVCWLILLAIMGLRIYLTSELSGNNAELYSRIQELETRENNLKQQIQDMTTDWNELNASRVQWSIDSYCLGNTDDKCLPCQRGWHLTQPSCNAYNNPPSPGWKTWEEAREDCKGKISDLAVAHDSEEKEAINADSFGFNGYWIGLRVEDGKWKWVDGSDLTDSAAVGCHGVAGQIGATHLSDII